MLTLNLTEEVGDNQPRHNMVLPPATYGLRFGHKPPLLHFLVVDRLGCPPTARIVAP